MSFEFKPAVRTNTPMIIGIAGPSGSGKTFTALTLAMGLAGQGGSVALIDTEGRRALHYADLATNGEKLFRFDHCDMEAPYTPSRLLEALMAAEQAPYQVIITDSFSDEYVGEGGLVDMADAELRKMRNPNSAASWARPKAAHKLIVRWMRKSRCHLIFCLRAEEKVKLEVVAGKTVITPLGWMPICEKNVPYEMATSFMLTPEAPGVPRPIKIQEQHRAFFPLDKPITRETGRQLAEWCAGGVPQKSTGVPADAGSRVSGVSRGAEADSATQASPELISEAEHAAGEGLASYERFWKGLANAERRSMLLRHEGFKEEAAAADAEHDSRLDEIDEPTAREP